ncbi:NYN domain-containing protein [Aliiroseovarius lamellibrachiae]|uniref:LabA-like NYN domain-containing protein n=1 Tax=Aliiroseovarius lamellibrachiae TaxID=1924933 RepID=UPI001BE0C4EB|nr:NYN domain-containing protein [Aliiroseovarius lamellibrachiae]MBT2130094.1 NYN domain-containing protein [Aliiroseovarius lamellibrachiae]
MIYNDERIALFVDGPNLYATAKKLEMDVDYKRLLTHFETAGRLVRASYFTAICETEEFQPLRPLVDFMQYNGWNIVSKPAREYTGEYGQRKVKGNMSVELTVEAIKLAPHIDHIILFSGDRDFCALTQHLQAQGKRVSVVSSIKTSPHFIADELRRQADTFIELDGLRDAVSRPPRPAVAA